MKWIVISVMDKAIGAFIGCHAARGAGAAVREFGDAVKDPGSAMSRHPEHYELWQVATMDDATGILDVGSPPFCLSTGLQIVAEVPS